MSKEKTLRRLARLVKDTIPPRLRHILKQFFPISVKTPEQFAMRDLLSTGDIAFDVGANVGYLPDFRPSKCQYYGFKKM